MSVVPAVGKGPGGIIRKPYDERTAADFRRLFASRFPEGDVTLLDTILANPARALHSSCGAIAYSEGGDVVAIQALLPRVAFHNQDRILVANAVAMSVKKDVDRSFFTGFLAETIRESGLDVLFGNTAIPGSRKRLKAAVNAVDGPLSCAEIREREVRSSGLAARAVRKAFSKLCLVGSPRGVPPAGEDIMSGGDCVLARECEMSDRDFDGFWEKYLKGNAGLVSSRTAEELRWIFGRGLASGEVILLTARKGGELRGYAFCRRTDETAACWRIADLIALGNDETILSALVEGASAYLRRRTPATCLQITGFPTWVQPLLKRLFPRSVSFGFNKCVWVFLNEKTKDLCGDWVSAAGGWYGCPYDGDMCII